MPQDLCLTSASPLPHLFPPFGPFCPPNIPWACRNSKPPGKKDASCDEKGRSRQALAMTSTQSTPAETSMPDQGELLLEAAPPFAFAQEITP